MAFSPDGSSPLIDVDETATDVVATITYATENPGDAIDNVSYSVDQPLPSQVEVTTSINTAKTLATVTVTIPNLNGFIPILAIDYMRAGHAEVVTNWEDLPGDYEQVFSYRKASSPPVTFTLTVEVEVSGSPLAPGTVSQAYAITISPNYTAGRDALIAAIEARS